MHVRWYYRNPNTVNAVIFAWLFRVWQHKNLVKFALSRCSLVILVLYFRGVLNSRLLNLREISRKFVPRIFPLLQYCKNSDWNSDWRKLSMIMVWERYCNTSPKPEFFLFSLLRFSLQSQLIFLGWIFTMILNIQKQVNVVNYNFLLFVDLHKPTLLPSTFKDWILRSFRLDMSVF